MYKFTLSGAAASVVVLTALSFSPAQATEGYFSNGYGAVNKSLAGAGVATGFDAMSQATNPASLTLVDPQFTGDLSLFSPIREYSVDTVNFGVTPVALLGQESGANYFLIPAMAGTYDLDDVSNFGWAFYGNGGMNTSYDGPIGPYYGGNTGVDLMQAFLQLTYAREIGSNLSVGFSPVFVAQRFKARGLSASFSGSSSDAANLSDNGYDFSYGYGAKVGVQADVVSGLRLGASYQTRMYMTEFDKYAGLFAEQGDFDIPPALQVGLSYDVTPAVTVVADYKRIWYSQIDAIANPISNLLSGNLLGEDNGPGFGWEDINAYKIGVQVEVSPTILVRAGFAYNDNPIPDSETLFNILAPGVVEQHYTAGLTWKATPNMAVLFGAMYAPSNSVSGTEPFGTGQVVTIEMYQWEATAGVTWIF